MRLQPFLFQYLAAFLVLGCGTAAGTCGCLAYRCEATLECGDGPADRPAEPACTTDPTAGPAEDRCGVFISSGLGDDANPGTAEKPVRTFERALSLARSSETMRIYACAETFGEAVMLPVPSRTVRVEFGRFVPR